MELKEVFDKAVEILVANRLSYQSILMTNDYLIENGIEPELETMASIISQASIEVDCE